MNILLFRYNFNWKTLLYVILRRLICPFIEMEKYLKNRKRIADVGCGQGYFSLFVARRNPSMKVYGFDPDISRLRKGKRASGGIDNVQFVCGYFVCAQKFDGFCLSDVLHHLSESKQVELVNSIVESLVPGGVLVVKEICTDDGIRYRLSALSDRLLYPKDHCFFRSREGWSKLLEDHGFTVKHKRIWYNPFSTNILIAVKP